MQQRGPVQVLEGYAGGAAGDAGKKSFLQREDPEHLGDGQTGAGKVPPRKLILAEAGITAVDANDVALSLSHEAERLGFLSFGERLQMLDLADVIAEHGEDPLGSESGFLRHEWPGFHEVREHYNAGMSLRSVLVPTLLAASLTFPLYSQTNEGAGPARRPPITGVAHIGLKTNDLSAARNFYGHDLGFAEAFTLDKPGGGLMLTYFKVNDHQYIEVFPDLKDEAEDRLSHICFETTDARALRDYLASRGVKAPDKLKPGLDGNYSMMVKDPDGHNVEFMEYVPGSLHSRNFGKALPASRISDHIIHVGVTVQDRDAADRFYRDILGFREMWHGGKTDDRTDWIDMRVPDGTDWLEYMLNVSNPSPRTRGVMNHLALGVPDVEKGYRTLLARDVKVGEKPKIGRDGKWQLNLYDPNLTRTELMEPKPVEKPCCSPMQSR